MNNTINPIFSNKIAVVFSSDENYAPYLGVTIQSLLSHINSSQTYDIVILEDNLSKNNKEKIAKLSKSDNVSIRYYNIKQFIKGYSFYTLAHFSEAAYYRIFVESIFSLYEKVIYCDCDAILLEDISSLYPIDLTNKMLGAVRDTEVIKRLYSKNPKELYYFNDFLNLKDSMNYFQSGLLIFNIKEVIKNKLQGNFLTTLAKIKTPKFVDQDILNIIAENKIKFLPQKWNIENHIVVYNKNLQGLVPDEIRLEYEEGMKNVAFLHYSSSKKPWIFPNIENAHLWWHYARQTPFYEEILYKNLKVNPVQNITQQITKVADMSIIREIKNYSKNRFNYYRCKLLANFTFGKMRKHYKDKKKRLKAKIKEVRRFLKGK